MSSEGKNRVAGFVKLHHKGSGVPRFIDELHEQAFRKYRKGIEDFVIKRARQIGFPEPIKERLVLRHDEKNNELWYWMGDTGILFPVVALSTTSIGYLGDDFVQNNITMKLECIEINPDVFSPKPSIFKWKE